MKQTFVISFHLPYSDKLKVSYSFSKVIFVHLKYVLIKHSLRNENSSELVSVSLTPIPPTSGCSKTTKNVTHIIMWKPWSCSVLFRLNWYRGGNTDTETEESYCFKFPTFTFVLRTNLCSFIEWVKEGILTECSFHTNHILQSYLNQFTCVTCLTRKRNVISPDNKHSECACSQ